MMTRTERRQSWPESIDRHIRYVNEELEYLNFALVMCRRDGFSSGNHILVTRLAPIIVSRMKLIDMAILEASDHAIDHAGRHPIWQKKLDFILASSDNLGICIQSIEYNIKHKRWTDANRLLDAAFREIEEMLEAIAQIPFAETDQGQGIAVSNWPVSVEGEE